MQNLYEGFNYNELQYIQQKRNDIASIRVQSRSEGISRAATDWLAIYAPYLQNKGKFLDIFSDSVYYTSNDIETSYPYVDNVNRILSPFHYNEYDNEYRIVVTNTTTGVKVYEYGKLMTSEQVPEQYRWKSLAHIEMLLVQNQTHKVKIFKRNNVIAVLTNVVNNRLLKELLTTIPSLFSLEELQNDTNVANCLKAVIKNEPLKEFFKPLLAAKINEQQEKINKLLKDSLTIGIRKNFETIMNNISNTERNITSYERNLEQQYETLQRLLDEKLGIESRMQNADQEDSLKELTTFINKNQYIKGITTKNFSMGYGSGEKLLLELEAPIKLYEQEPLQRQITNLYSRFNNIGEKCLDVLAEIFLKDKYQLYCTTYVGLELGYGEIDASYSDLMISLDEYLRMPQPHLSFYNCWGDAKSNIRKSLRDGSLIDAIQIMLINIQNINFTDTAVLSRWIEKLQHSSYLYAGCKCIKDQEGNWFTFKEINEILEAKRKIVGEPGVAQPELIDELEGEE